MAETSPSVSMDTWTCSNNDDVSKYTHDESATIHLNPTIEGNDDLPSLYARVRLESTSTLTSSTPLLQHHDSDNKGTPFSQEILHLLSKFKLHRLMIQIGDRASSNGSINEHTNQFVMGPSGTSITASFLPSSNSYDDNDDAYKIRYASLLRYLLDKTFFPACGAPLDSVRERKHGHSIVVRIANTNKHDNSTQTSIVKWVTSNLPADGWGAKKGNWWLHWWYQSIVKESYGFCCSRAVGRSGCRMHSNCSNESLMEVPHQATWLIILISYINSNFPDTMY